MYASLKNTHSIIHSLMLLLILLLLLSWQRKGLKVDGTYTHFKGWFHRRNSFFFLLAQLASLSSASSSFYSTSFLFFSFFFSSFACHIFKEASPCQNCQLLLHKLCPSQIWQKIEKDSRFWNVMHQCIIRLNSWHTNMMDRYLYFYVWMLDFVYFIKFVYCLCTCKNDTLW